MKMYAVFSSILVGLMLYAFSPQVSLDSAGMWSTLLMATFVASVGWQISLAFKGDSRWQARVYAVPAITLVVVLAGSIWSSDMLNASRYHALLGEEKQTDFKSSLPPLSLDETPLVSDEMAYRAAEKKLSEIPALGSVAVVGELQKQIYAGELVWVGYLEHRSLWRWLSSKTTPGYVVVSANDPSRVRLVTELDGKPLTMRYLQSGYFNTEVTRHLRLSGYYADGLTDLSPEIDDSGKPYIVATVFDRKVGFSGPDARGVVVLDVQSGDSKFYAKGSEPGWVDRVQPYHFIAKQVQDRLEFVHGWFNPSKKDQLRLSGPLDIVYAADGRSYFFAGITSTGTDGGLVGFMMIDSKSKEVSRYALTGVVEYVAQAAAQGVNPEKAYKATNALPFMVNGSPAYVMSLRDSTGIARSYGVVSIEDYQRVAVADTLESAVRLYQTKRTIDKTGSSAETTAQLTDTKAKVVRIGSEVRGGNTGYLLVLEGHGASLFAADVNRSEDLAVTVAGDEVQVRFLQAEQRVKAVMQFTNLTLSKAGPAMDSVPVRASSAALP